MALCVLWKLSDNSIALLTLAIFGIGEAIAHTRLGIISYINFHDAGLSIPYSPGYVTALLGFLVVAILLISDLKRRNELRLRTFAYAFVSLVIVMVILVAIPENGMKDTATPYCFPSAGFYEKYITAIK